MFINDIDVLVILERIFEIEAIVACSVDEIDPMACEIRFISEENTFEILDNSLKIDNTFPEKDFNRIDKEDNADCDDCKAVDKSDETVEKYCDR